MQVSCRRSLYPVAAVMEMHDVTLSRSGDRVRRLTIQRGGLDDLELV